MTSGRGPYSATCASTASISANPSRSRWTSAAYRGDLQIELIHVTNEARSPYRDTHGQPLVGLHHVAWVVDDLDAALARLTSRGLRVVFDARNPATRVAYLDDTDDPGVRVEVIEGAGMRDMIARGIAEARAWDGADPVRIVDAAAASA